MSKKNDSDKYEKTIKNVLNEIKLRLLNLSRGISQFLYIFIDIPALILISITSILYINSGELINKQKLVIDIVITLLSGLIGAIYFDKWKEVKNNVYLIKKSDGAIRNLRLIKYKVKNIQDRIDALLNEKNKRDFEEVNNLVNNIHQDIINSISDWSDINENAIKTIDLLEEVFLMENKSKEYKNELNILNKKLSDQEKSSDTEKNKLKKQINEKSDQIYDLNQKINKANNYTFSTISSGASLTAQSLLEDNWRNSNQGSVITFDDEINSIITTNRKQ